MFRLLVFFEAFHRSFIPTRIETRAEAISKARSNPLGPHVRRGGDPQL